MTAREEVERLLAEHDLHWNPTFRPSAHCTAGDRAYASLLDEGVEDAHRAHVAQVLDEAGLLADRDAEVRADERRWVLAEAADRWQQGAWADVLLPKPPPDANAVLAYAQRVTDWMRGMAKAAEARQKPVAAPRTPEQAPEVAGEGRDVETATGAES